MLEFYVAVKKDRYFYEFCMKELQNIISNICL